MEIVQYTVFYIAAKIALFLAGFVVMGLFLIVVNGNSNE